MPFVRGHQTVSPRTPRNTCVYTRHPAHVTATCGVLARLPAKLAKNGMRVKTSADRRLKKKWLTANWLKGQYRHDQSRLSTGHGIGVPTLQACNFVIAKKKRKWLSTTNFVQCFIVFYGTMIKKRKKSADLPEFKMNTVTENYRLIYAAAMIMTHHGYYFQSLS